MIPLVRGVMFAFDRRGGEVLAVEIDIGEDGRSAGERDAGCRGGKAARRDDHLVIGFYLQHFQGKVERQRSICQSYRVAAAKISGIGRLELADVGARPRIDLSGPQDRHDIGNLLVVVEWPASHGMNLCSTTW